MFKTEGRTFTRDEFFTECKKAADEFQALRKAVGSTVDLTHGYYAEVGASAWAIIWQAIEDKQAGTRVLRVITAPAGSGKTTHAEVAALAIARLGGAVLLVVNQIDKADQVYRELAALLPGKVAVWTREHDTAQKVEASKRKLDDGPAATFTQDELINYPTQSSRQRWLKTSTPRKPPWGAWLLSSMSVLI
jgi:hypothetical protein